MQHTNLLSSTEKFKKTGKTNKLGKKNYVPLLRTFYKNGDSLVSIAILLLTSSNFVVEQGIIPNMKAYKLDEIFQVYVCITANARIS